MLNFFPETEACCLITLALWGETSLLICSVKVLIRTCIVTTDGDFHWFFSSKLFDIDADLHLTCSYLILKSMIWLLKVILCHLKTHSSFKRRNLPFQKASLCLQIECLVFKTIRLSCESSSQSEHLIWLSKDTKIVKMDWSFYLWRRNTQK